MQALNPTCVETHLDIAVLAPRADVAARKFVSKGNLSEAGHMDELSYFAAPASARAHSLGGVPADAAIGGGPHV